LFVFFCKMDGLSFLPIELYQMMLSSLNARDLAQLIQVNRFFHQLLKDDYRIWFNKVQKMYGPHNWTIHHYWKTLFSHYRIHGKPTLKLVLHGNVDSGKKTLAGHLLVMCGLHKNLFQEIIKEDNCNWRPDQKYSKLANKLIEKTISFESSKRIINLYIFYEFSDYLLSPRFFDNQFGIAVIGANIGEFEASIEKHGMLRKQLLVIHERNYNNNKVIIVVNKMDIVLFSRQRYEEIEEEIQKIMKRAYFQVHYVIPVSALKGDNLVERSENMDWYKGPTLIQALDRVQINTPENFGFYFPKVL